MTRISILLIASALISACTPAGKKHLSPEPVVRIIEVPVPVASACIPETLSQAPVYPDTDSALKTAGDAADRYLLLAVGRMMRIARLGELEQVVTGCPKAASK